MSETMKRFLGAVSLTTPSPISKGELVIVTPRPTLDELAVEINADYAELTQAALTAVEKAIAIGKKLIATRAQLKHGEFIGHVTSNYSFTVRWGQQCMKLADHEAEVRQELERMRKISSHLSLTKAFEFIGSLNPRPKLRRKKAKRAN